jgi:hypothetical protein
MSKGTEHANLVALMTRAKDVPGQWIAHCLDLDVMTQGKNLHHAMEMLVEAVLILVQDDIEHGFDPLDRSQAPDECWAMMKDIRQNGVSLEKVDDPESLEAAIGFMQLTLVRPQLPAPQPARSPELTPPPAWEIAALRNLRHSQAHC